ECATCSRLRKSGLATTLKYPIVSRWQPYISRVARSDAHRPLGSCRMSIGLVPLGHVAQPSLYIPKDPRDELIKIYLAGPLGFSEAGRAFHNDHVKPLLQALGHVLLDPWADLGDIAHMQALPRGIERQDAWRHINHLIGRKNQLAIDECDAIFAVLDG